MSQSGSKIAVDRARGCFHQRGAFGERIDAGDVFMELGKAVFDGDLSTVVLFGCSAGDGFISPSSALVPCPVFFISPAPRAHRGRISGIGNRKPHLLAQVREKL